MAPAQRLASRSASAKTIVAATCRPARAACASCAARRSPGCAARPPSLPVNEIMSTSGDVDQRLTDLRARAADEVEHARRQHARRRCGRARRRRAGRRAPASPPPCCRTPAPGPILPAQLVIGKLNGVMQATTPTGSRTAMPERDARPGPLARGASGVVRRLRRQLRVLERAASAPRPPAATPRPAAPRRSPRWSDRRDRRARVAKPLRGVTQQRAALGAAHARPRPALEGLARRARGLEHLRRATHSGARPAISSVAGSMTGYVPPAAGTHRRRSGPR